MLNVNNEILLSFGMLITKESLMKSHVNLISKNQIYISKRFMLSRGNMATKSSITLKDAEQLARSALGLIKTINDPKMVAELGLSSKNKNVATPEVTDKFLSYIKDDINTGGTATIKTNFLAIFVNQNKHLTYNYNDISKNLHPKVKIHESLIEKNAPVRALVEIPIAENFVTRFIQIKGALLLGDNIPIVDRTKNINRDLLIEYNNGGKKDMDIKTSVFDEKIHYGNIREIAVNSSNELISFPRNFNSLPDQYTLILRYLKKYDKKNLTPLDEKFYDFEVNNLNTLINKGSLLMQNHQAIENSMMNINSLPSYNSNLNFNNIYYIKESGNVTPNEIKFLEAAIKNIDTSILERPSVMQNYLVYCLHLYNQLIDPKTSSNLKPLIRTYPFIKDFLKNNDDIYF